jgi:hypothetical protein
VGIEDGEEKIAVLRVGRASMVVVEGPSELNQVDDLQNQNSGSNIGVDGVELGVKTAIYLILHFCCNYRLLPSHSFHKEKT